MNLDHAKSRIAPATGSALRIYLLGLVEFEVVLHLQRMLAYQAAGERHSASLILCEHPPLITVGRDGSPAHIRCDRGELRDRQWPMRWVNRGGGVFLHVPGQLAIYPIVPLDFHGLGVAGYLERLQRVLVALLGDFGVRGSLRTGQPGVWASQRPIAGVGVAVRDWVAYFGAVLNINPNLLPFRFVRTGPHEQEPMTSLERERRGPLRPSRVRERLLEHFTAQFAFERTALFFHHPCLEPRPACSEHLSAI